MRRAAYAATLIVVMFTASACRGGGASEQSSSARDTDSFIAADINSASATDRAIALAQQRIKSDPANDAPRLQLAQAFLQKAREVADPSLYKNAQGLLEGISKRQAKNPDYWVTLGTLQLARHQFKKGNESGHKATELAPESQAAYGVLVDANNELGNTDAALEATQKMADLKPNATALARVSYARELRGDLPGAIEAMTQAVTASGSDAGENGAYVRTLLGNLLLTNGDAAGAEQQFREALVLFPDFAAADAGLARVLIARDRPAEAATLLGTIVDRQPMAEYAVLHGDALMAAGQTAAANKAYDLVGAINKLYAANDVNVDRETALFNADHHPTKADVAQAKKALKDRGSKSSHDVLAWTMFKNGSVAEADKESDVALADGTKDPQENFHGAAIALAKGNRAKATERLKIVLQTNPRFSPVLFKEVQRIADELGLTVPGPAQ